MIEKNQTFLSNDPIRNVTYISVILYRSKDKVDYFRDKLIFHVAQFENKCLNVLIVKAMLCVYCLYRRDSIYATKQLNDINIIPTTTVQFLISLLSFELEI